MVGPTFDTERADQSTGDEWGKGAEEEVAKAMVNILGWDWLRS